MEKSGRDTWCIGLRPSVLQKVSSVGLILGSTVNGTLGDHLIPAAIITLGVTDPPSWNPNP